MGVTLKIRPGLRSLRSRSCSEAVLGALKIGHAGPGFRVVHFAILGNHLHLIVEADGRARLSAGVQGLEVRIARAVNRAQGRTGRVFADRYHAHVLKTPTEVARARRYVLDNFAVHERRAGRSCTPGPDRLSSASLPACAAQPATWLLRVGFRRGLIRKSNSEVAGFRDSG